MVSSLVVVHKKGDLSAFGPSWYEWKTCLRHILIGHSQLLESDRLQLKGCDIYKDIDALRFLMEVASGLHSPMVAETEVFGQYRKFINSIPYTDCQWGVWLKNSLEQIRLHVKRIRFEHLVGVGSQSYGSLVRRKSKGHSSVNFVGSGALVQEILPWLAKHKGPINIYCRDPKKAKLQLSDFNFINIKCLKSLPDGEGALIVCAPLKSSELAEGSHMGPFKSIIDLRGESRKDPLQTDIKVESLDELFEEIQKNKDSSSVKILNAQSHIAALIPSYL